MHAPATELHWGIVLRGWIHLRYADGTQETTGSAEAYRWPGGHTGWTEGGVVFHEVSQARELQPVLDHLAAQFAPA